jgi:hypothetical protein
MNWEKVAKGGVETHILPVYPTGMMVEPFVEQLADELKDCIDRALCSESLDVSHSNVSNTYHDS